MCSLEFLTSKKFCTTFKNLQLIFTNIDRVIRHINLSFSSFWNKSNTSVTKVETCLLDKGHSTHEVENITAIHCSYSIWHLVDWRVPAFWWSSLLPFLEHSWNYLENTSSNFPPGTCTNCIALCAVLRTLTLSKILMFYRIKLDVNQESVNSEHRNVVFSP